MSESVEESHLERAASEKRSIWKGFDVGKDGKRVWGTDNFQQDAFSDEEDAREWALEWKVLFASTTLEHLGMKSQVKVTKSLMRNFSVGFALCEWYPPFEDKWRNLCKD